MPIKITPTKGKKKKQSKKPSGAAPFMMPGQKKMLDKMMGKSKPQTLKGGGGLKKRITSRPKKETEMEKAVRLMNKDVADIPKNVRKSLVKKKGGGGLKAVPQGNKGKGLSKLPTEVRNKMGYMKKGGKVMKMRGGGAATRGLMFNNR